MELCENLRTVKSDLQDSQKEYRCLYPLLIKWLSWLNNYLPVGIIPIHDINRVYLVLKETPWQSHDLPEEQGLACLIMNRDST